MCTKTHNSADLVANRKNVYINLGHILHSSVSCKIMWTKIHVSAVGLNVWRKSADFILKIQNFLMLFDVKVCNC
jgi:hypothetical protein